MKSALAEQLTLLVPAELAAAILAMLPVTELRGALPVAILFFELPPATAYLVTVAGNLVPLFAIFLLLPGLLKVVRERMPRLNRIFEKKIEGLKKKHGVKYSKWGAFFLFLFVSIPLPGTGVWTGSVLAVLFEIRRDLAMTYISLGLLVAGLIVLAITQGVFNVSLLF